MKGETILHTEDKQMLNITAQNSFVRETWRLDLGTPG